VRAASRATAAALDAGLATADPAAARAARNALRHVRTAAAAGDAVALAAARGATRAALLQASATAAIAAAGRGDARAAADFLLLRDFRTATRFTRPGVDATNAVDGLAARRVAPAAARLAVAKDLLDAYQAKLRELLDDAAEAAGKGFAARTAASSAQAAGYWAILRARYRQDLGAAALARADAAFERYARAGLRGDARALAAARRPVDAALHGFVAAPFTAAEEARRAQQLLRFLDLVPVEYGRGVKGDRVTLDFEIAEAAGFRDGAAAAFSDLEGKLARRDRPRTDAAGAALDRMGAIVATAQRTGAAAPEARVKALASGATAQLKAAFPAAWKQRTDDADLDLVDVTLDRLDAAVSSGQWRLAEQARLEAYAFIEFGPERKLQSFDPGLAFDIEGLVWFGARGHRGLAELIAHHAPREQFRPTRLALDRGRRSATGRAG
jgi:high-affinity iron transporter